MSVVDVAFLAPTPMSHSQTPRWSVKDEFRLFRKENVTKKWFGNYFEYCKCMGVLCLVYCNGYIYVKTLYFIYKVISDIEIDYLKR